MQQMKIAITGGPSGGKTTLIDALKREMGHKVTIVPEAASILYRGGFPRKKTTDARVHIQKAIYYTQQELEALITFDSTSSLLVCDRGSLDGAAYWPGEEADFFKTLSTTKENELNRYQYVLHLDTAGPQFYDTSNPIRTETYQEASELNQKIKNAWNGHKQRIIISSDSDFLSKMTLSMRVIESILGGLSYEDILKKYNHLSR